MAWSLSCECQVVPLTNDEPPLADQAVVNPDPRSQCLECMKLGNNLISLANMAQTSSIHKFVTLSKRWRCESESCRLLMTNQLSSGTKN